MDLHLNPYSLFGFVLISAILYTRTSESGDPPKLIVISFDGFRPDYVKPDLTPTLYKLAQEGVFSKHMKSEFGTKTFPNHMSIATGMYEESHGIIQNHVSLKKKTALHCVLFCFYLFRCLIQYLTHRSVGKILKPDGGTMVTHYQYG